MDKVIIDTDILSYFLKGEPNVVKNFKNYLKENDSMNFSIITYYEIISGLLFKNAHKQLEIFEQFTLSNNIIFLTEKSCRISGELYSKLRQQGSAIDDIDLLIAGVAIENDFVLITNNVQHFKRIPGLKIENWIR